MTAPAYAPNQTQLARRLGLARSYVCELTKQAWFPDRGPRGWDVVEVDRAIDRHVQVRPGARRRRRAPLRRDPGAKPQKITPAAVAQAFGELAELPAGEAVARYAKAEADARGLLDAAIAGSSAPAGLEDAAAELAELVDELVTAIAGATLVSGADLASWLSELLASVPAWSSSVDEAG